MGVRPRVLIVGGGFAGLMTAKRLAADARAAAWDIVVVDASISHVFTPWIYEIASGNVQVRDENALDASASVPLPSLLAGHANVQFRHARVTGCDFTTKHIVMEGDRTTRYDVLVLAPGAEVAYFGISGLPEHALPLKRSEDAAKIRKQVLGVIAEVQAGSRRHAHIVTCGVGPSGSELAAELAMMVKGLVRRQVLAPDAIQFTMVDAGARVLPMCSPHTSQVAAGRLKQLGINVLLETMLTGVSATHLSLKPRKNEQGATRSPLASDTELPYDILLWCGGIVPSGMLAGLDLPKDPKGRVRVGLSLEVPTRPGVFVVGDAAFVEDPTRKLVVPQTAQAAMRTANVAAENIIRIVEGKRPRPFRVPWSWPFVVTLGGRYGVAEAWGVPLAGILAYALRRTADADYFLRILPWKDALRTWWKGVCLYSRNDG